MRKKLLPFVAIATMVFFVACNKEDILTEPEETFSFTAIMPEANPTTRVTLDEDGKDIVLGWEEDDVLNVFVTQGGNTAVGTASITKIYDDGKKATFNPELTGDPIVGDQPFNFYGVYGGRGLSDINALLPLAPSTSGSLDQVQNNNDVMLYFAAEGVTADDIENGVVFKHLGSLFKITVQNNCETGTLNLEQGAQLEGINNPTDLNWAYDFATQNTVFNLTNQTFENTGTGINTIAFTTNTGEIAPGDSVEYWSWYPILSGNTWPELKFRMIAATGASPSGDLVTVNSKPARITTTDPVIAGQNYRFYVSFDGDDLNFTNDAFEVPEP